MVHSSTQRGQRCQIIDTESMWPSIVFFSRIGGWGLHQSRVLWLGRKWRREEVGEESTETWNIQRCQTCRCGTLVSSECKLFCWMYFHAKTQVLVKTEKNIRELSYSNPRLQQRRSVHKEQVRTCNNAVRLLMFSHAASEQTELLLYISRLPLRWLVTHRDQNST
jgi:hypothetical protein